MSAFRPSLVLSRDASHRSRLALSIALSLALAGCGGGGGGSTDPAASSPDAPPATIAGVRTPVRGFVSKAPVDGATCTLLNAARQAVGQPAVSLGGRFDFGQVDGVSARAEDGYTVQCSGGTYVDEATGARVVATTLQAAAVPVADGSARVAVVTPLTHLAWLQAGADVARLPQAAQRVARAFGLEDVDLHAIEPTDLNSSPAQDDAAGRYGTLLAAIAQHARDGGLGIDAELTLLNGALNGGDTLAPATAAALRQALTRIGAGGNAAVAAQAGSASVARLASGLVAAGGGLEVIAAPAVAAGQPTLLGATPEGRAAVAGGPIGRWRVTGSSLVTPTAVRVDGQTCSSAGRATQDGAAIEGIDCGNVRSAPEATGFEVQADIGGITVKAVLPLAAPAPAGLTLALPQASAQAGRTLQAQAAGASTAARRFSSRSPEIAAIDPATGLVTLLAPGRAQLVVEQDAVPGEFAAGRASVDIEVTERSVPTLQFEPGGDALVLPGEGLTARSARFACASETPYAPQVLWSSSHPEVVAVDAATGLLTTTGAGSATIRAAVPNVGSCAAQSGGFTLTVAKATPRLAFADGTPMTLVAGAATGARSAEVIGLPAPWPSAAGLMVSYASSDPAIASVSPSGVVSGLAPGVVTITATVAGDAHHFGSAEAPAVRASYSVQVSPGLKLGGRVQGMGSGKSLVLQANGVDSVTIDSTNAAHFVFPTPLAAGSSWSVGVLSHPIGQSCRLDVAQGSMPVADFDGLAVTCQDQAVATLAGSGSAGATDGPALTASFRNPTGVATGADGVVYVADFQNHRIRRIAADGSVTTLAGSATSGALDGQGSAARFNRPIGLAVGPDGHVYVADTYNHRIRRISPAGVVTTLAGSGLAGSTDASNGLQATFNLPSGIALDAQGVVYVADTYGNRIRRIARNGAVTTLAGNGVAALRNGTALASSFNNPTGIAVDAAGNVYVGDTLNRVVRLIAPGGLVTTLAGSGAAGAADGVGAAASFDKPYGIAVTPGGQLYVADLVNQRVRAISPSGVVTTLAGSGAAGNQDGPLGSASFRNPYGVAVDRQGVVYVAEYGNHRIRRIRD